MGKGSDFFFGTQDKLVQIPNKQQKLATLTKKQEAAADLLLEQGVDKLKDSSIKLLEDQNARTKFNVQSNELLKSLKSFFTQKTQPSKGKQKPIPYIDRIEAAKLLDSFAAKFKELGQPEPAEISQLRAVVDAGKSAPLRPLKHSYQSRAKGAVAANSRKSNIDFANANALLDKMVAPQQADPLPGPAKPSVEKMKSALVDLQTQQLEQRLSGQTPARPLTQAEELQKDIIDLQRSRISGGGGGGGAVAGGGGGSAGGPPSGGGGAVAGGGGSAGGPPSGGGGGFTANNPRAQTPLQQLGGNLFNYHDQQVRAQTPYQAPYQASSALAPSAPASRAQTPYQRAQTPFRSDVNPQDLSQFPINRAQTPSTFFSNAFPTPANAVPTPPGSPIAGGGAVAGGGSVTPPVTPPSPGSPVAGGGGAAASFANLPTTPPVTPPNPNSPVAGGGAGGPPGNGPPGNGPPPVSGFQGGANYSPNQRPQYDPNILGYLQSLSQRQSSFDPIADQAKSQFYRQTIPSIAERFAGMGNNSLSSPAFASQLGESGSNLHQSLASMKAQHIMQERGFNQTEMNQVLQYMQMENQNQVANRALSQGDISKAMEQYQLGHNIQQADINQGQNQQQISEQSRQADIAQAMNQQQIDEQGNQFKQNLAMQQLQIGLNPRHQYVPSYSNYMQQGSPGLLGTIMGGAVQLGSAYLGGFGSNQPAANTGQNYGGAGYNYGGGQMGGGNRDYMSQYGIAPLYGPGGYRN
jgi:hypothetical protein